MASTVKHAKRELALLGYTPLDQEQEDGPNKWAQENILQLLEVFDKQEKTLESARYVIGMFFKLASFEPLRPLTGEDSEWEKVDYQTFENIRYPRVFKNINTGIAFDIEGKIFEYPDGARFTSKDSIVEITFPYTPRTEIVKVSFQPEEQEFENVSTDTVQ
jgi:hypothetical protein